MTVPLPIQFAAPTPPEAPTTPTAPAAAEVPASVSPSSAAAPALTMPEPGRLIDETPEHDPVGHNLGTVLVLLLAILATAVGVVLSKHQSRKLFVELQGLQKARDDLDIEWNQLQLEQSTLATESVIDQAARTRLDMGIPAPDAVIYVIR